MYQAPTKADLKRNLLDKLRDVELRAGHERARIQSLFNARGTGRSGAVIQTVVGRMSELHAEGIANAMHVLEAFISRGAFSPGDAAAIARPHLEGLSASLVGQIPTVGFQTIEDRFKAETAANFSSRVNGALRDLEIGFIGGQNMAPIKDADRRAVMLRKFYDERHLHSYITLPLPADATTDDRKIAANICRQLAEAGLVEWKAPGAEFMNGMGRITSRGIDVVEGTAQAPISISIDRSVTVTNSHNVQAGDFGDHATVSSTATTIDAAGLATAIKDLTAQLERLRPSLPESIRDKVEPTIAELQEASAAAQPEPGRLRRGLEHLKSIMEIAAGDLVASGTLTAIEHLLRLSGSH